MFVLQEAHSWNSQRARSIWDHWEKNTWMRSMVLMVISSLLLHTGVGRMGRFHNTTVQLLDIIRVSLGVNRMCISFWNWFYSDCWVNWSRTEVTTILFQNGSFDITPQEGSKKTLIFVSYLLRNVSQHGILTPQIMQRGQHVLWNFILDS